ncbi:hypothetical protein CRE_21530 [Caenorhabditis remanei]|uniref:RING-type domain-containing protein n=1 Tax=Caenorhabditis remanei TaxID=31234 RepID=E3NCP6_CAERE|nr:hypothetical protein CRE_21530 [Caenorhabditis remanei]
MEAILESWKDAPTLFPEEPKISKFLETEFLDLSNLTSGFIWKENQDKWILTNDGKQYESNYSHMPAKLKKKSKVKYFVMERVGGPLEASNMTNIEKYKKAYNIENLAVRCFKPTNKNDESFDILLEDIIDLVESLSDQAAENNLLQTFKSILEEQPKNFYEARPLYELSTFFDSLDIDKTQVTIIPDAYQNLTMQKTRNEFFTPITTVNSYGTVVMDTSQAMLYTLLKIVIGIDWFKEEQKIGADSMNEFKKKFFALMKTYEDRGNMTFVSKHFVDQQIEIAQKDEIFKQVVRKIPDCFKDGQNMNNEITRAANEANLTRYSLPTHARMKTFTLSMQWCSHIFGWINSFYLHEKPSQKLILLQAMYCKLALSGASPIDKQLQKDVELWTEQTTDQYKEVMAGVISGKPNVVVTNYETELKKRRKESSKTSNPQNGNTSVLGNVRLTSIVHNAQQKALEVLHFKPFLETSEAPPPGSGLPSDTSYSTSQLDTSAGKFEPAKEPVSLTVAAKTPKAPPLPEKKQNEAAPIERTKKPASLTIAPQTSEAPPLSSNEVAPIERSNDAKYWRDKCFTAGEHCSNALKAQKSAEKKAKEYETKAKRTEEVEKEMKKMKKEMEKLKENNEKMEKELEEANETIQKKKEKEMKLREELKRSFLDFDGFYFWLTKRLQKGSSETEKLTLEATNKSLEDQILNLKEALALSDQARDEALGKLQELQISQPSTSGPPSYKSKLEELMNLKDEFEKRLLKTQAKKMSDVLTAESDDPAIKEMVEKELGIFRKSYDEYLDILLRNIRDLNKFLGTRPLIPLPAEPAIPEKLWEAYRAHTDPHKPLIGKNECHFCYGLIEPSQRTAHCGHEKCEAVLHFECARNWYTTGTKSVECMYCKEPFLDIKAVKRGPWRC